MYNALEKTYVIDYLVTMLKGSSKWFTVICGSMGSMLMGLSFPMITNHLETIHKQFNTSVLQLQWMINIYGIFVTAFLVSMGRLGDIFGRKKIYLTGISIFIISMIGAGCAFCPSMIMYFMALYGVSGAIIMPLSQAIMILVFPEKNKSMAISIWAAANGITLSLGPILGGFLCDFSWRWIFFISVPIAIITLILTIIFVKESQAKSECKKVDWIGLILLMIALGSFVFATIQSNLWPLRSIIPIFAISIISFCMLLKYEKTVQIPIFCEKLFRNNSFLFFSFGAFFMNAVFWSVIFLVPFYFQNVLGFRPIEASILMLSFSLPIFFFSPLVGFMCRTIRFKNFLIFGFALLVLSSSIQLNYSLSSPIQMIIIANFILGLGFSFVWTSSMSGALSSVSKNYAGVASGTGITMQEIGGNLGLAISVTAVRCGNTFELGFYKGILTVFIFSVFGFIISLFIPNTSEVFSISVKNSSNNIN